MGETNDLNASYMGVATKSPVKPVDFFNAELDINCARMLGSDYDAGLNSG